MLIIHKSDQNVYAFSPLVSSQWLFDRLVPTNGSDHGVETDLEQLHGAGLPVSISRHTVATVGYTWGGHEQNYIKKNLPRLLNGFDNWEKKSFHISVL